VQGVIGTSATSSGVVLTPLMLGAVVTSIVTGQIVSRTGRYRWNVILGPLVLALGMALLWRMDVDTTAGEAARNMVVAGIGIGSMMQVFVVSVQNAVLPWQLGTVTGVINFVRALASALMVALYGAFLFGAEKGVTLETIAARNGAALEGHFRWIFAAAALCLAVSWLFLLAMEERPLRTGAREGDAMAVPAE